MGAFVDGGNGCFKEGLTDGRMEASVDGSVICLIDGCKEISRYGVGDGVMEGPLHSLYCNIQVGLGWPAVLSPYTSSPNQIPTTLACLRLNTTSEVESRFPSTHSSKLLYG